jgi:hypothetical protein
MKNYSVKFKIILSVVFLSTFFTGVLLFYSYKKLVNEPPGSYLTGIDIFIGDKKFSVDSADTPEKRTQGLSGRERLYPYDGLLFTFDAAGRHGIWMKDMLFAIDIVWLDENGQVIHIVERADPSSFPQVFEPADDAKYVLEVDTGFVDKNSIKLGTKIDI